MQKISEPLHPDFQKILQQFVKRYGQAIGTQYFHAWVNQMGLDDSKPYGHREKFQWAQSHFRFVKQDKTAKYYEVEAAFPLSSMNRNVYTEFELERAARTLVGKPVNINHESHTLKGVMIDDAEYEDGAVECLLKVLTRAGHGIDLNIQKMIEEGDIVHVSIEASCRRGIKRSPEGDICLGLNFTGLALLTKDALPGIPLTRIMPVEQIVESFHVPEVDVKMKEEKTEKDTAKAPVKSKKKTVTEKLAKLEFQVSDLKRKYQKSKEDADLAKSHLDIKEKAYNVLQVSNGELERNVDTLDAKLEQLKETHENVLKQHSELTADYTKLRGKHEELSEEHKGLVVQSEHTSQLLGEEQKAHYDASSEKIQLTQDLTERNNEILEVKTQIQGLNVDLTKKNREISTLQEENKKLTERLKKAKRLGKIVVKV